MIVFQPKDHGNACYVLSMGVVPEWWRQGIAAALKTRTVDIATPAGADHVRSEVHYRNTRMRNLNKKVGIDSSDRDPEDDEYLIYAAPLEVEPGDHPGSS